MSNVPSLIAILSNQDIIASELSSNFDVITQAMNSNALNSDNYGLASINSSHLADDCVITGKIKDAQVSEAKLLHTQASSGVKVLRLGPNSMGGEGHRQALVINSFSITGNGQVSTITGLWGAAQDGDPAFQAQPRPSGVEVIIPGQGEVTAYWQSLASDSYQLYASVVQSVTETGTNRDCTIYAYAQGQV
jgi:hypothetical protein